MWMWFCVERGSDSGFGNSWNQEDRMKYCEAKKQFLERNVYDYGSESSGGSAKDLICFVMVKSCLELPNRGLGR